MDKLCLQKMSTVLCIFQVSNVIVFEFLKGLLNLRNFQGCYDVMASLIFRRQISGYSLVRIVGGPNTKNLSMSALITLGT